MASGLTSTSDSEPIEPTRVWTAEEWEDDERWSRLKAYWSFNYSRADVEATYGMYSGMPREGDVVNVEMKDGRVVSFDFEA